MNTNKDKIISKLKQEDQPSKGLAQPKLLKKKSNFYNKTMSKNNKKNNVKGKVAGASIKRLDS